MRLQECSVIFLAAVCVVYPAILRIHLKRRRFQIIKCCGTKKCSSTAKRNTVNNTIESAMTTFHDALTKNPPLTLEITVAGKTLQTGEIIKESIYPTEVETTTNEMIETSTANETQIYPTSQSLTSNSLALKSSTSDSLALKTSISESSAFKFSTSKPLISQSSSFESTILLETSTNSTSSTTTTTTQPTCVQSQICPAYRSATFDITKNSTVKVSGSYMMVGARMLFKSKESFDTLTAFQSCLRLDMVLLAVETLLELLAIEKTIWSIDSTSAKRYWTSGDFCSDYNWCSSNLTKVQEVLVPEYWQGSTIPQISANRCVTLEYFNKKAGLSISSCNDTFPFMCEPKCSSPTCPDSCQANTSLFENSTLKKPEQHGYWASTCGSVYLFTKYLGNWSESHAKCCSLGMTTIALETMDELNCLSNFTSKNWGYNFNYWTAGTSAGCKGQWAWCSSTISVPMMGNMTWASNQPDNADGNEKCMHMKLLQNNTGIVVSDRNCSKLFVIACEQMHPILCGIASCPNQTCALNNSLLDANNTLKDYFSYGSWINHCGRTFLFSANKVNFIDLRPKMSIQYILIIIPQATWKEADRICCSIGMTLLSVEYLAKHTCLVTKSQNYQNIFSTGGVYWTSGTDSECDGKYRWCRAGRNFIPSEVNWAPGEPNLVNGDCVVVKFLNGTSNLTMYSTAPCTEMKNFVCEVRNKDYISHGVQKECAEVWNISASDIISIEKAFNATNISPSLKCFIKCMGESMDLFLEGDMLSKVLRLIEELAAADESALEVGFQAYNGCNGKTYNDECEAAAALYQCGLDTAPALTNSVFASAKGNNTLYSPPVPCISTYSRRCQLRGHPCILNSTARAEMLVKNSTSFGSYKIDSTSKSYFFGELAVNSFINSYNACCSIGMMMAEFPSLAALQAMVPLLKSADPGSVYNFAEVFANGDGTDSWCGSGNLVPKELYSTYTPTICNFDSCPVLTNGAYTIAGPCAIDVNRAWGFICY
ncbi:uncharacterized protein LOC132201331 isoform X2 [Neocloeon triangulifer]|uniref:uncharacterized protein LOC132201331 isoform X2 n=1 Tax=Neocloeon triangulifer TaxID=2078957 RepID=UPI00286F6D77|nr:uncharacterized protein LOC132201331 isoform X2 [Neocloeon triangulifer]